MLRSSPALLLSCTALMCSACGGGDDRSSTAGAGSQQPQAAGGTHDSAPRTDSAQQHPADDFFEPLSPHSTADTPPGQSTVTSDVHPEVRAAMQHLRGVNISPTGGSFDFFDLTVARPDGQNVLAQFPVDPEWRGFPLGGSAADTARGRYFVISSLGSGPVLMQLDGATGTLLGQHPCPPLAAMVYHPQQDALLGLRIAPGGWDLVRVDVESGTVHTVDFFPGALAPGTLALDAVRDRLLFVLDGTLHRMRPDGTEREEHAASQVSLLEFDPVLQRVFGVRLIPGGASLVEWQEQGDTWSTVAEWPGPVTTGVSTYNPVTGHYFFESSVDGVGPVMVVVDTRQQEILGMMPVRAHLGAEFVGAVGGPL